MDADELSMSICTTFDKQITVLSFWNARHKRTVSVCSVTYDWAACWERKITLVSASSWDGLRSISFAVLLQVNLTHRSLHVTPMVLIPIFFLILAFSSDPQQNLKISCCWPDKKKRHCHCWILWPGLMLVNWVPVLEPPVVLSDVLLDISWCTSNTMSVLSLLFVISNKWDKHLVCRLFK